MITVKQQQQYADEWKKVSMVVESEARRQLLTIGRLDYSILNDILREERLMWFKKDSVRRQWLDKLPDSDKKSVTMKIRQVYLQDDYRLGDKNVIMIGLRLLYLLLSILAGSIVWLLTHIWYSPTIHEYTDSPLKWIAFPLLTIALMFTFCHTIVIKKKKQKVEDIIKTLKDEMNKKGQEILDAAVKHD